jgi:hypothetical protein
MTGIALMHSCGDGCPGAYKTPISCSGSARLMCDGPRVSTTTEFFGAPPLANARASRATRSDRVALSMAEVKEKTEKDQKVRFVRESSGYG